MSDRKIIEIDLSELAELAETDDETPRMWTSRGFSPSHTAKVLAENLQAYGLRTATDSTDGQSKAPMPVLSQ